MLIKWDSDVVLWFDRPLPREWPQSNAIWSLNDRNVLLLWTYLSIVSDMLLIFQYVTWRHHQMETCSALLALCAGNSPVTGEFPSQRPVTRSFDVSLICALISGWVNNREAGDLRRNRAHYDFIVMLYNAILVRASYSYNAIFCTVSHLLKHISEYELKTNNPHFSLTDFWQSVSFWIKLVLLHRI